LCSSAATINFSRHHHPVGGGGGSRGVPFQQQQPVGTGIEEPLSSQSLSWAGQHLYHYQLPIDIFYNYIFCAI
jgi:hypothetical protein